MSLRLPIDLYSIDQLSAVILELNDYIGKLRDISVRSRVGSKKEEAPNISALLMGVFNSFGMKADDINSAEKTLENLKKIREKSPVVHITLADLPNRMLKRQLTVWFRTQVHEHALINFAMRRDIGGGLMLRVGSHVYNLSLRHLLIENKSRIAEIFENVRQH